MNAPHSPPDDDGRPLILCANDDGYFSRGLRVLAEVLSSFARVVVVAPETEQSATSHSLTLHRPLRLRRVERDRYALDGTPADCVYLALHMGTGPGLPQLLSRKPDLVVSGINRGINLGQDVFYSGTVAAAREGALRGVPAIAVSVEVGVDDSGNAVFEPSHAAQLTATLAKSVLTLEPALKASGNGRALLLNLNVPVGPVRGIAPASLGTRTWTESVEARIDPRGRVYYWIAGQALPSAVVAGSDTAAFDSGLATLTVLGLDLGRNDPVSNQAMGALMADVKGRSGAPA